MRFSAGALDNEALPINSELGGATLLELKISSTCCDAMAPSSCDDMGEVNSALLPSVDICIGSFKCKVGSLTVVLGVCMET